MGIDTSIYGMVQGPKIKSPGQFQSEALTLRNLGLENEYRQQQTATARALEQQRMDELNRQQAFREAAGRGASEQELLATDPDSAMKLSKSRLEGDKEKRMAESADATRIATQYETQRKKLTDLTSVLSGVTDEPSYIRGIRNALDMGILDPAMAEQMASHPYNPDEVKQLGSSLMTMKERIDLQEKLDDAKRKQAEHEATLPGKAAESQGKVMTQGEREANKGLTAKDVAENNRQSAEHADLETYRRNTLRISENNSKRMAASSGRDSGQRQVTNEGKLRDDFTQAVKPFKTIAESYGRLRSSNGQKGVSDIALLYGYMKMLDPGSVVRESEFATGKAAGSLPDYLEAAYKSVASGEKLSSNVRDQITKQADAIYKQAEQDYSSIEGEYRGIAERSNVDPRNVLVNFRSTSPGTKNDSTPAAPKKGERRQHQGANYEFDGTQWVRK